MNKVSFNHNIEAELEEIFSNVVERVGGHKYEHVEGAVKAYLALPDEIQDYLRRQTTNTKSAEIKISAYYRDKDSQNLLDSLPPADRAKVIAIAKETLKIVSQKK